MKEELDAQLCEDFPEIFRDRHAPMIETCMCWGIAVGDGWEPIIRKLCEKLSSVDPIPVAVQVKEKFGVLCFYLDGGYTKEVIQLLNEAEAKAKVTCEDCGQPGSLRTEGRYWILTLCDNCDEVGKRKRYGKFEGSSSETPTI